MKLAFIADIHEDIINLKKAFRKIEKAGCDEIICLGDISGFTVPNFHYYDTRNAHECLKLVREKCKISILGNHDLNAAQILPKHYSEFKFPGNWYEMDYQERNSLSQNQVWLYEKNELDPLYTHEDKNFLKSLPEFHIYQSNGLRVLFSHYIFPNLVGSMQGFFYSPEEFSKHFNFMDQRDCTLSFTGHFHSSGLYISTQSKIIEKSFGKKYYLNGKTVVCIPPVTSKKIGNGFCIFDTDEGWVKAVRL